MIRGLGQLSNSIPGHFACRLTPLGEDGGLENNANQVSGISLDCYGDRLPANSLSSGHQPGKPRTPRVAIRLHQTIERYTLSSRIGFGSLASTHVKDEFESVGSLGVVLRSKVEVFPNKSQAAISLVASIRGESCSGRDLLHLIASTVTPIALPRPTAHRHIHVILAQSAPADVLNLCLSRRADGH